MRHVVIKTQNNPIVFLTKNHPEKSWNLAKELGFSSCNSRPNSWISLASGDCYVTLVWCQQEISRHSNDWKMPKKILRTNINKQGIILSMVLSMCKFPSKRMVPGGKFMLGGGLVNAWEDSPQKGHQSTEKNWLLFHASCHLKQC